MSYNIKQVIVVRKDLRMSAGKTAVQACHACLSVAEECRKKKPEWFKAWISEGQKKVVLAVDSLDDLKALEVMCEKLGIPSYLVSDAGLTELEPGTVTALGIGPAPSDLIDKVTGNLRLL